MRSGLVLDGVTVARGGFEMIKDVDLVVESGQVTVVLGPNGAGKTTLLEAVSGIIPVKAGTIRLGSIEIQRLRRARRARLGLSHVEQGRTVFAALTLEENLFAAAPRREAEDAFELFPELAKRRFVRAGLLSGGEQQMLVLARALVQRPKVLLIDELSLGLAPLVLERLMPAVRRIADDGVGVLLVEQYADLALAIGDQAYVLDRGKIAFSGTCTELHDRRDVLARAYLAVPSIDGSDS